MGAVCIECGLYLWLRKLQPRSRPRWNAGKMVPCVIDLNEMQNAYLGKLDPEFENSAITKEVIHKAIIS